MNANADIIYCIFKEFVSSTSITLEKWKLQLPLLSVCRSWRKVGVPIVYSQLYLGCSKKPIHRIANTAEQSSAVPNMYVVSNIDLVTLLGFNSYSKTIHIVREHSMNLYDFVSQSISALDQFDGKWSNASSLIFKTTLNMQPVNMDPGRFETQNIFTFERLNQLASSITVQMPNLVHVCAAQNNDIGLITVVANRVVSAIAFQVKHLTTKVYRYIYAGSFSRNLTNLGLTFAPAAIQNIPKVCAPTLKRLELFGVFQNFSWNSFGDDSYAHCLAFSNLEALCIHFVDGPDMLQNNKSMAVVLGNDFIKSFNFPKLRYLDINHTITSSTFLHYANFPSRLPCLEIHLSPNDSVLIRDVPFGDAERRELAKHFSNSGIKTETIKLVNQLFGSDIYANGSELALKDSALIPSIKSAKWKHLQKLRISAPLDLSRLIETVISLQQLESLSVDSLTFVQDIVLALDEKLKKALTDPLTSLNTSIKNMQLKLAFEGSADNMSFSIIVKYLILRVPTLQQLKVSRKYRSEINAFIDTYSSVYPHLANLAI